MLTANCQARTVHKCQVFITFGADLGRYGYLGRLATG